MLQQLLPILLLWISIVNGYYYRDYPEVHRMLKGQKSQQSYAEWVEEVNAILRMRDGQDDASLTYKEYEQIKEEAFSFDIKVSDEYIVPELSLKKIITFIFNYSI